MRKIFVVITLAATLLSLLGGCGQKELEPIEKAQAKAVEIGEQYLNFEITAAEAKERLKSIKVPETEGNGQVYLDADIGHLAFIIAKQDSSYEDIKKKVERIASQDYTD
jgi:predicted small lipoprotein YifL